jgi:hypothetical protein
MYVLQNGVRLARGSEGMDSIERRHPGFCTEMHAIYNRGVATLELYQNCFGPEASDFKHMYKQAANMIADMHRLGLLQGIDQVAGTYICAYPGCNKSHGRETLQRCSRCLSVRYCGKACQKKHWKSGHKKECPKLAKEREERLKANPRAFERPDIPDVKCL